MTHTLIWLFHSTLAIAENVEDPHIWLEGVEDEKALDWVKQRNLKTVEQLTDDEGFNALQQQLQSIYDSKIKSIRR